MNEIKHLEFGYQAGVIEGLKTAERLIANGQDIPGYIQQLRDEAAAARTFADEQYLAQHRRQGHEITWEVGSAPYCTGCNMTGDVLLIDDGWIRTEKGWKKSTELT